MLAMMLAVFCFLQQPAINDTDDLFILNQGQPVLKLDRQEITSSLLGWPHLDEEKLTEWMTLLAKKVYQAPADAKISEHGTMVAEKTGAKLRSEEMLPLLLEYYYGQGTKNVEVALTPIYPKVDRPLLKMLSQKRIASYVTYYKQHNENRSHNIGLSSQAINSYVVFPGEIFSFNEVVGQRTKAKGYKPAPVIVRGEFSEGIGGGICQVSSTLFNAVDRAGLKIVSRYSHSREVPYVPPGRDATVSWGGPDFRFRNEYAFPIMLRSYSRYGQIVISVYSFAELEYEPRRVPEAAKLLPDEVRQESEQMLPIPNVSDEWEQYTDDF